ncbi:MAG TPA: hypothetical protein VK644_06120 [Chitinophagaceae bacterium]|nr:hypothetical protein [Chitinophagaceae bacterium]
MKQFRIQPDKWKHFFVGIILGAFLYVAVLQVFGRSLVFTILTSLTGVALVSYGFELFSLITRKGQYDVLDAVASVAGGIVGIAFILSFYAIVIR